MIYCHVQVTYITRVTCVSRTEGVIQIQQMADIEFPFFIDESSVKCISKSKMLFLIWGVEKSGQTTIEGMLQESLH